jgi:hypothetical protein
MSLAVHLGSLGSEGGFELFATGYMLVATLCEYI